MVSRVEPLDVWLYGIHVARLTQPNSARVHYRMDFTEEALDTYGEGRRILSLALPVSRKPVADAPGGHLPVTSFLKGLLPEGNLLQQLATAQRVPTSDQMALLRAVGADCAGAIQFLRAGTSRPQPSVRRLSSIEVTRIVADLPTYNLPDGTLSRRRPWPAFRTRCCWSISAVGSGDFPKMVRPQHTSSSRNRCTEPFRT